MKLGYMTRPGQPDGWLAPLQVRAGAEGLAAATAALRAALDGTGPAIVPVPAGPVGAAVLAMARPDEPLEATADAEQIALVAPTSGSTGEPKGALLPASALRASAAATLVRLGGPGQWLLALPLTHIAGLQVVIRSLLPGIDPVAMPDLGGFEPAAFAGATARLEAPRRYTALVPTQLRRLLDGPPAGLDALVTFDAVLVGGAALDQHLRSRALACGVRVVTTYGMSETCGGCVYDGMPLDGVQVDAPDEGPIRIGGAVVFIGYRLRPELTAIALDVLHGVRWHVTADLGALDQHGRLLVHGRVDDVIVTGGEKVAPASVERVLRSHPAVSEVVVLGVEDPAWGQRVVAVVVPRDGAQLDLPALRAHTAGRLAPYAQPRELVLVPRIPMVASGKPNRSLLRRIVHDGTPAPSATAK